MHLILIGMMGSGKTTVGKSLSEKISLPWIDSDQSIEAQCKKSITAMFETDGEAFFRNQETSFCKNLAKLPPHIISTGGGIILSQENRNLLRKYGHVFWLKASIPKLLSRLQNSQDRPLLANTNLEEKLTTLMTNRSERYKSCAHFIIETDALSPTQITEKIKDLLP